MGCIILSSVLPTVSETRSESSYIPNTHFPLLLTSYINHGICLATNKADGMHDYLLNLILYSNLLRFYLVSFVFQAVTRDAA